MALLLHIETATKVCSTALSENGRLIDVAEESSDKYIHAERLTVLIEDLMKRNALSFDQLDAVSVTSGPGSYTGLRIGVSTAKGLCYAKDLPLIAIGALDCLIELAQEAYPDQSICAMIDARRMEVFSKIVDKEGNEVKPVSADELDEERYKEFRPFIACGDAVEKTSSIWQDKNVTLETNINSSARGHVVSAYQKFKARQFEDLAYFEPFYLKDFVALKSKKSVF